MSYWPLRDVTGSHGVAVQAPPAVGSLLLLVGLVLQLLPAGSLLLQLLLWTTEGSRQLSLGGTPGSEREPAVKPAGMAVPAPTGGESEGSTPQGQSPEGGRTAAAYSSSSRRNQSSEKVLRRSETVQRSEKVLRRSEMVQKSEKVLKRSEMVQRREKVQRSEKV